MDDETKHFAKVIRAKQDRLNLLDVQAAKYGLDVPPHIAMERVSLQEELSMVETAIASPARAGISDELGPRGRFVVNHQQNTEIQKQNSDLDKLNREIKTSIGALAVKLDRFIEASEAWRNMHRQLLLIIGIVVIIVAIIVTIIVTYLVTKGVL